LARGGDDVQPVGPEIKLLTGAVRLPRLAQPVSTFADKISPGTSRIESGRPIYRAAPSRD